MGCGGAPLSVTRSARATSPQGARQEGCGNAAVPWLPLEGELSRREAPGLRGCPPRAGRYRIAWPVAASIRSAPVSVPMRQTGMSSAAPERVTSI